MVKNIHKSISSLLLSSALLAVGGIALANGSSLSASAEEGISPAFTIILNTPKHSYSQENTMVQYTWTGDDMGYMHVGDDENPNRGYITVANSGSDCVYKEVQVPSVGGSYTTMKYIWAQSFYEDEDGDIWESDRNMFTATVSAKQSVTESIVSGTIKSTYTTLSTGYTVGQTVYWTVAYNGEVKSDSLDTTSNTSTTDWKTVLSGVTFRVYVKNNIIKVKASKSVTCSNISSSDNGYAAFAIYVK